MRYFRAFDAREVDIDKALVEVASCTDEFGVYSILVDQADDYENKEPQWIPLEKLFSGEFAVEIFETVQQLKKRWEEEKQSHIDSPETKAVVEDMNAMVSNDTHEQMMGNFVPDVEDQKETLDEEKDRKLHEYIEKTIINIVANQILADKKVQEYIENGDTSMIVDRILTNVKKLIPPAKEPEPSLVKEPIPPAPCKKWYNPFTWWN